jgi:hypothetical protein
VFIHESQPNGNVSFISHVRAPNVQVECTDETAYPALEQPQAKPKPQQESGINWKVVAAAVGAVAIVGLKG